MKKITAVLLALCMLFALCACGSQTVSGGNATDGDAYTTNGNATSGNAYSGTVTGTLPVTEAPAEGAENAFCISEDYARLYMLASNGGTASLLIDDDVLSFDRVGDTVLAALSDGTVKRIDLSTGNSEDLLTASGMKFSRIHAFDGGFIGEYYSITESKLYLYTDGGEPEEIFSDCYLGNLLVSGEVLIASDYSGTKAKIVGYSLPSLEKLWETPFDASLTLSSSSDEMYLLNTTERTLVSVDPLTGQFIAEDASIAYTDSSVLYGYNGAFLIEGNYDTGFAFYYVRGGERLKLDIDNSGMSVYMSCAYNGKALICSNEYADNGDYGWSVTVHCYVLDMETAELYPIDLTTAYRSLFADGDFPVIDSSTARKPLTAALYTFFCLETGYGGSEPLCSTTHGAWLNIADRKADIAFLAAPTDEEQAYLDEQGVEVEMKLYGGDGLVFIGSRECGVTDLTLEQVKAIFRGEITNWSELGGADHAIHVLYRDDQSGSQRLFEKMLFGDEDVPDYEALGFERLDDMSTLVTQCLNDPYSIGYSIMTYLNDVYSSESLLAFSINGVDATADNVRSGDYALGTKGYVVIRSDEAEDSPARRLYDFFGTPLADAMLEGCGITPLSE